MPLRSSCPVDKEIDAQNQHDFSWKQILFAKRKFHKRIQHFKKADTGKSKQPVPDKKQLFKNAFNPVFILQYSKISDTCRNPQKSLIKNLTD